MTVTEMTNEELGTTLEERMIAEEYKIWKKNTPYLYDYVMTHGLEWPSLTIQFFPSVKKLADGQKVSAVGGVSKNAAEQHEFLIGTHTTGEQNYLMVGSVNLPKDDVVVEDNKEDDDDNEDGPSKKQKTENEIITPVSNYNQEKNELGGHTPSSDLVGKIEIKMKIPHAGEVNRARFMPQNHFVVATRGPSEEVFVWDLSKHESFSTSEPSPQLVLKGHTGEGYGLAWCGVPGEENMGRLATCSDDKTVMIWDVKSALAEGKNGMEVSPYATLKYHTDVVEDVDWHKMDANMVGSVGDDRIVCLWDVRKGSNDKPVHLVEKAHGGDVNCIEFHPTKEFMFATGGSDEVVKLWDMRNLKSPLQTLKGHTSDVYGVHWSPFNESIIASCSADRRIALWDLSRIGAEQAPEDAEDGPPELLFMHGGHTSKVSDFSWNANNEWCMASVSEDNVLQVWCPAEDVYCEDGDEDECDDGKEDLGMKPRTEILGDDELE
ncbi:hypothetical protein ACHAWO_010006 [Cyclotella atomus]|uniref:Histone-binding protein RBBP4 N-terminal domain-containing protein n=1 Tax=Cyclotella atomus TaxID=382360 RepID=A0ABD3MPB5_9STRA